MSRKFLLVCTVLLALYIAYNFRDDFNEESVRGKRVIVTGASTGIGEQLAYQFARHGADVIVTARREAVLKEVVAKCRQARGDNGGKFHYLAGDMSSETFYSQLIQEAVDKLGGIDFLVLNHIIDAPMGFWKGNAENITMLHKIMQVNFHSYVSLASHALPHLERSGGAIIVLSSVAGIIPEVFSVPYTTTKFALNGFFNGLRHELAIQNSKVSVTVCTIGFINTPNAIEKLTNFGLQVLIDSVPPANASDTALDIMKGGASRHRNVFTPYVMTRFASIFGPLFPETMEIVENMVHGV